jgi:hypothetical protein
MSLSRPMSSTASDQYERAAGLVRTMLGGVELSSPPERPVEPSAHQASAGPSRTQPDPHVRARCLVRDG